MMVTLSQPAFAGETSDSPSSKTEPRSCATHETIECSWNPQGVCDVVVECDTLESNRYELRLVLITENRGKHKH